MKGAKEKEKKAAQVKDKGMDLKAEKNKKPMMKSESDMKYKKKK